MPEAVEGVMLKRRDAPYLRAVPGTMVEMETRPDLIDAVLMYAQRGHGKRLVVLFRLHLWSLDSDDDGEQLVPVGKAYFGFTDEEPAADRTVLFAATPRKSSGPSPCRARKPARDWCWKSP